MTLFSSSVLRFVIR